MKRITGYAVVAPDGFLLLHTVRRTRRDSIATYEMFYNRQWEEALASKYAIIKLSIAPSGTICPVV